MRVWTSFVTFLLAGCGGGDPAATAAATASLPGVDCSALIVTGDTSSDTGARWTYRASEAGLEYQLSGTLFTPVGTGPFPGVVVSHGFGGNAAGYSSQVARVMRGWGMAVIATNYTHAPDDVDAGLLPQGDDGASVANVQRARKARDLLGCLGIVDTRRVAAHGHSMGAFVTGQLLGTHPGVFLAASHTAGGATELGPNATRTSAAANIITPYQLHHGDADTVVDISLDRTLDQILGAQGVPHELHVYPGYTHSQIALDPTMLERVRAWYQAHGLL